MAARVRLADPLAPRLKRLERRILASSRPIIWIRALAGAGKSRLLARLATSRRGRAPKLTMLDQPGRAELEAALDEIEDTMGPPRRLLLVASRPDPQLDRILVAPELYGQVERLEDRDLFASAADCADEPELFARSGGWPVLLDAARSGREAELVALLPEFLDRQVLPSLAPQLLVLLFAGAISGGTLASSELPSSLTPGLLTHPLLVTRPGIGLTSTWVREALITLARRADFPTLPVAAELTRLYARASDPVRAIRALIDIGQRAAATELFEHSGGMYFGYRHGYAALEDVLAALSGEGEATSVLLAQVLVLMRKGRTREAQRRLEGRFPQLAVDLRGAPLPAVPQAALLRFDLELEAEVAPSAEVITSWARAAGLFPNDDHLGRGMLYNTMTIGYLQCGAWVPAREFALEALAQYEEARSPYLIYCMQLHLCDLALRQSSPAAAAKHLQAARRSLRESGLAGNSEAVILKCFEARIDYEEGHFERCPTEVKPILETLLNGDSWSDLVATTAACCALASYWESHLANALEVLDRYEVTLARRHGSAPLKALSLPRIQLHQIARRYSEAAALLEPCVNDAALRRSATLALALELTRLRQQLAHPRPVAPLLKQVVAVQGSPHLTARQRVALLIWQAFLQQCEGARAASRRSFGLALREAEPLGLVAVFLEEGEFVERVLPVFKTGARAADAAILAFAERITERLQALPCAPLRAQRIAGVSRQEHRVLCCVADGWTNKQVARSLRISQSTVKFHLRNLFAKLEVSSRRALVDSARRKGITP